ncbi:MAG: hypothetical protein PHC38_12460 [Weeksellaceae bacterium]|nr:hypothetical protein [Weeksellaceae bacterium]
MKYLSLLIVLISGSSFAQIGQFATVNDVDGFSNIRSSAEINKENIIEKLDNGTLVFVLGMENDWYDVDYGKDESQNGYIYKNRILFIEDYLKIDVYSEKETTLILKNDNIEINIIQEKFNPDKHKLTFDNWLTKINGKSFWGTDGGIPKTQYQSIKIKINNKNIDLPKTAFYDLFEPNWYHTKANYDGKNDVLYLHSFNSDGAGGYAVIWKIEKGKYKDRLVVYGF